MLSYHELCNTALKARALQKITGSSAESGGAAAAGAPGRTQAGDDYNNILAALEQVKHARKGQGKKGTREVLAALEQVKHARKGSGKKAEAPQREFASQLLAVRNTQDWGIEEDSDDDEEKYVNDVDATAVSSLFLLDV